MNTINTVTLDLTEYNRLKEQEGAFNALLAGDIFFFISASNNFSRSDYCFYKTKDEMIIALNKKIESLEKELLPINKAAIETKIKKKSWF